MEDAINQITDAASGWLVVAEDEGLDIPKATRQAVVNRSENDFLSLIQVDTCAGLKQGVMDAIGGAW